MTFLSVLETKIDDFSVRIYRNTETKLLASEVEAQRYVKELIDNNLDLFKGEKLVAILWESDGLRMADIWVFGKQESDNAGASVSVCLFKEFERYESPNVTAADGLVVLGAEAAAMLEK